MKYKVYIYTYQHKETQKVYSGVICAANKKTAKKLFSKIKLSKEFRKIGVG